MEQLNPVERENSPDLTLLDLVDGEDANVANGGNASDDTSTEDNASAGIEEEDSAIYEDDNENTAKRFKIEQEYIHKVHKFYDPQLFVVKEMKTSPELLSKPLDFYKNILELVANNSRLNQNTNLFLSSAPPDQNIRVQTISAYWEFLERVFKESTAGYTFELKYMLRYGIIVTSAVSPLLFDLIKKISIDEQSPTTVYYVDEWLQLVSEGNISQSVMNEAALTDEALLATLEQKATQLEHQNATQIQSAIEVDDSLNENLDSVINSLGQLQNQPSSEFGFSIPFSKEQDAQLRAMRDMIKNIQQKNVQIETKQANIISTNVVIQKTLQEIAQIKSNNPDLQDTVSTGLDEDEVPKQQTHTRITYNELKAIRQMAKMCVGKRGNHFPILFANYFSGPISNFGTRERTLEILKEIESIDYTLFRKMIKDQVTRSFPLVLLVPCYGQSGICWEPFERLNRNTSSAKLIVPMYSHDLRKAIICAVADYRWQFEKEKASHLWMEEGLTGWYFQWHDSTIKKGDIKAHFIMNYLQWINWESKGVQKVDKKVRNIFWRFLPFSQATKKRLEKRSPVYAELLRKDKNRDISGQ